MSAINISGDTSGAIALTAPLVAGTNTITLPAQTGTLETLGVGTAVASTSGTSITFTGIPSWAKRITVMFNNNSLSGTASQLVQLGSGSATTTGYVSSASRMAASTLATTSSTSGFLINTGSASILISGTMTLSNLSGNTWVCSNVISDTGAQTYVGAGLIALSGTLDRVVITTTNGTDTFDSGSINIMYEG